MGLETGTYISDLNPSWPVDATDVVSEGDDHLRLIKATTLNSFPGITGAMTLTHAQLNQAAIKNESNTFSQPNTFSAAASFSSGVTVGGQGLMSALEVTNLSDLKGNAQVGGTLDVTGKATFSNAAFISSASGIGVTVGYKGAKFTIKQSGAALTNGLQILSAGDDDYSGYLVATFASRKFAVGANGRDGDPALGGSLDFDDFGYGWSLFAGDGGETKRKILSSTRSGIIEAPLGQIQGGGSGVAFDLRAGAADSQTRILGSNSQSTGGRLTLFGPSFGGANGLEFHWQNSLKLTYVTAAQKFDFQTNAIDCGALQPTSLTVSGASNVAALTASGEIKGNAGMKGTVTGVGVTAGEGRFEVVSALPGTPNANTVYFVV